MSAYNTYCSTQDARLQPTTVRIPLDYEDQPMITDRDARAETHAPTPRTPEAHKGGAM